MVRRALVSLILVAAPAAASAQGGFTLDIPTIMRGPETVGREPGGVRWTPDSEWIYFTWLPPGSDWRLDSRQYRVRARAGAVPEQVSQAHVDSLGPVFASGLRSRTGKWRIVGSGGDLWMVELPSGKSRRLTMTLGVTEQPLTLSVDEKTVYFRDGTNAFSLNLANGMIEQLTDIRTPGAQQQGGAAAGPVGAAGQGARQGAAGGGGGNPQRAALERDQRDLLAVMRDNLFRDSVRTAERGPRTQPLLPQVTLGRDERLRTFDLSPAGRHAVIVTTTPPSSAARNTIVPNYVTSSGYTEDINSRSKVGEATGGQRLGVLTLATGKITWLDPLDGDSARTLGGLSSWGWNDDGTMALVQATTEDNERRILSRIAVTDSLPAIAAIEMLEDSAWVGGPCGGCGGWLPGDAGVWFVNESDGWAHLYRMNHDGDGRRQLTSGKWEVLQARLSDDRSRFEMHTSEGSVYERHFFTMNLDGSARTRWTAAPGGHSATLSPDGRQVALVSSTSNRPPELFLQPARPMAPAVQITTSPTAEWLAHDWIRPEIVEIPASDGAMVPARIYRPEDVGSRSNGAAVIFVHGAGYLHNVHNYWSTYYREYQFHHLLAEKGYVVLDIDYRGSAGYGRDWRTAIYRHMGGRDLEDHVDASKYLTARYGIHPERIGIYGGSYGGFITLMALFTRAEYFGAGAALRAVTDWAHYNHGYTSPILNLPQDDTTAYRRSSPIFFAEGLEDPLLIAHGMVDVNVHFQDVVRLAQRLIELGKDRWEMAVYPVEDHGFVRPDSWTDEYRRILELFDRWLPEASGTRE